MTVVSVLTGRVKPLRRKYSTAEAKNRVLDELRQGASVADAMASVFYAEDTYKYWRKQDAGFKAAVDRVRSLALDPADMPKVDAGTFEEFCVKYLGMPLYTHQMQWVDLLEGRTPRGLHPSQRYEFHGKTHFLVNCPPEHAKSTTITINYVTYLICKFPNIRIRVVSKTLPMAREFVYAIQQRLTHPRFQKLQSDFAPGEGGFKGQSAIWKQDTVYLGAAVRDSAEKDPTLQALGMGGQIYGARADVIVVDDAVTLANSHEYERQIRWLQQEVLTRLGPTGRLLVIGTRVDSVDLYKELRDGDRYPSGESPWTYLSQPAVLEFAEQPRDWVTLWPRNAVAWDNSGDRPDEDGLFPRWDGKYLSRRRNLLSPRTWAMAYMQAEIDTDSVFSQEAVRRCVNGMRRMGPMHGSQPNVRPQGMEGLRIIGGLDPAMSGDGAIIVYGFDPVDNRRYVLEARVKTAPTPAWITGSMQELTEKYHVHEWVIEKNGYQASITKDQQLIDWFHSRGVVVHPHFTGNNKNDVEYGVAGMAGLFESQLIELPSSNNAEAIKQLIEQLITWRPSRPDEKYRGKQDLVMALWFCELRAKAMVQTRSRAQAFTPNKYLSQSARRKQVVVPASALDKMSTEWIPV